MPSYGQKSIQNKSLNSDEITFSKKQTVKFSPNNLTVKQKELLIFFRQLAVIIQSGVPLAQGIELLAENTRNEKFASLHLLYSFHILLNV